jgi:hypothetical protein
MAMASGTTGPFDVWSEASCMPHRQAHLHTSWSRTWSRSSRLHSKVSATIADRRHGRGWTEGVPFSKCSVGPLGILKVPVRFARLRPAPGDMGYPEPTRHRHVKCGTSGSDQWRLVIGGSSYPPSKTRTSDSYMRKRGRKSPAGVGSQFCSLGWILRLFPLPEDRQRTATEWPGRWPGCGEHPSHSTRRAR